MEEEPARYHTPGAIIFTCRHIYISLSYYIALTTSLLFHFTIRTTSRYARHTKKHLYVFAAISFSASRASRRYYIAYCRHFVIPRRATANELLRLHQVAAFLHAIFAFSAATLSGH